MQNLPRVNRSVALGKCLLGLPQFFSIARIAPTCRCRAASLGWQATGTNTSLRKSQRQDSQSWSVNLTRGREAVCSLQPTKLG